MNLRCLIPLGLAAAICFCQDRAEATLGEAADTIAKDRKALSGVSQKTLSSARYRVQQMASGTGKTAIREYVSPSGIVFAVAWNGFVRPNLKVLLGSYHNDYQKALSRRARNPGHREMKLVSERLVVETWGHMRNLQGRAYLPGLLPEGVNIDEIR
ncbi:MAG: DUF2844 domain-containing protein [Geobacter sp.]|nr:MAG: DUF2844 domain-containing protein [Geobacter sp.]